MNGSKGTLELLARHLTLAVQPLQFAVADLESFKNFMYRLGWEVESLPPTYTNLATRANDALETLNALGDDPDIEEVHALLKQIQAFYGAIKGLSELPSGVDVNVFLAEIRERLFETLLVDYLAAAFPALYNALQTLGIIEVEYHEATPTRPAFLRTRLQLEEIPRIVSDPSSIPGRVYGWGTDDLEFALIARHLHEILLALRLPASIERVEPALGAGLQAPPEETESPINIMVKATVLYTDLAGVPIEAAFAVLELPAEGSARPGIILQPLIPPEIGTEHRITDALSLRVRAGSDLASTFGILLRPGELLVRYPFQPGTEPPSAGFGAALAYAPDTARVLLGRPLATRLQLTGATAALNLDFPKGEAELRFEIALEGFALVLAVDEQDGFLSELFGDTDATIPIPLAIEWSNRTGLHFAGSAGFEVSFYPHLSLGPITADKLQLGVSTTARTGESPDLVTGVDASLSGALGPVAFSVEGIGMRLVAIFKDGNAGPFGVDLGFKPPEGLGLAIDAGAVVGGGFLFFDPDEEQYAGEVHLEFEGGISLNAIGLLTTRLPDGSKGFSLLVIVTASGFKPINLGFGFTLNGVGGLLGINRTAAVDVLRERVRDRTLDGVLFSKEDPAPRAAEIVSVLRSVFPPAPDRYVFGPMAVIGWGTPTVLTLEVAVVLELLAPLRLIVVGRLRALLPGPDESKALVKLNMDALGVVEFERREASVDATLYDSSVAGFPITGDMALRANWGERPGIALAVGGFHPRFLPPPGFPKLRRLAITLSTSDNPRLRLEAYLALTTNTVQLGARLDLFVEAGGFSLSGMMSFDALAQFAPFEIELDLAGELALKRGSRTLMGVEVRMHLTGPAPWHARGAATFRILFFSTTVRFEARFGAALPPPPPVSVEVWPLLMEALTDARNWGTELPTEGSTTATVRAVEPDSDEVSNEILVHPLGEVSVRQRVVPLEREISRFANAPPADYRRFRIQSVLVGTESHPGETTYEPFAPAQFFELSDDEKLASPGFDRMPAGTRVPGRGVKAGPELAAPLEYETIVLEPPGEPAAEPLSEKYTPAAETFARIAETGAAGVAELRSRGRAKFAVDGRVAVSVSEPVFVVRSRDKLGMLVDVPETDDSFSSAREALLRFGGDNPRERENAQIVRREEAFV